VFQLSDGAQAIGAGALRGAGDTRASFVANVIGHYAVGMPIAIVLGFVIGMGAPGLWWGLTAGLTGTAVALVGRFLWLTARPIKRVEESAHGQP
jgi:MATE family multidrug resistance protein